jgi:hypothetical protein
MRPEEISLDALPRVRRDGVDPEAAADLLRKAAWELMEALAANQKLGETVDQLRARVGELEGQLAELETRAAKHREPDELTRSLLESVRRVAHEQRESARHEAELTLKKARSRAAEIEAAGRRRVEAGNAELAALERLRAEVAAELRSALEAVVALSDEPARAAELEAQESLFERQAS